MTELNRRASDLSGDEIQILDAYRRVRERKFGDLEISVSKGKLVKVFEIIKNSVLEYPLRENATIATGVHE